MLRKNASNSRTRLLNCIVLERFNGTLINSKSIYLYFIRRQIKYIWKENVNIRYTLKSAMPNYFLSWCNIFTEDEQN